MQTPSLPILAGFWMRALIWSRHSYAQFTGHVQTHSGSRVELNNNIKSLLLSRQQPAHQPATRPGSQPTSQLASQGVTLLHTVSQGSHLTHQPVSHHEEYKVRLTHTDLIMFPLSRKYNWVNFLFSHFVFSHSCF